jgi:ribosomal protein L16 Arg81 hydroxylase
VRAIERRLAPSPEVFLREYADTARPAILRGLTDGWRAVGSWTFDRLAREHGAVRVSVLADFESGRFEEMTFADYVRRTRAGESLHFSGTGLLAAVPELWAEIERPLHARGLLEDQPLTFFSRAGVRTPLHYDLCHNLYAQLTGRKRFVLLAPHERRHLRARSRVFRDYWRSPVDVDTLDEARTAPFEAILEPGDTLFIPGGWWHAVQTLEESVALAFFFEHGLFQRAARRFLRAIGRPQT